jgi:hypothetical protein
MAVKVGRRRNGPDLIRENIDHITKTYDSNLSAKGQNDARVVPIRGAEGAPMLRFVVSRGLNNNLRMFATEKEPGEKLGRTIAPW